MRVTDEMVQAASMVAPSLTDATVRRMLESALMLSQDDLRQAVTMMGFDPEKLAHFANDGTDYACKAILLGCVGLNDDLLKSQGASSLPKWQEIYARLRLPRRGE